MGILILILNMEMDIDIVDVEEDGGGVDDEKRIGKRVEMSDALAVLWMDNSWEMRGGKWVCMKMKVKDAGGERNRKKKIGGKGSLAKRFQSPCYTSFQPSCVDKWCLCMCPSQPRRGRLFDCKSPQLEEDEKKNEKNVVLILLLEVMMKT